MFLIVLTLKMKTQFIDSEIFKQCKVVYLSPTALNNKIFKNIQLFISHIKIHISEWLKKSLQFVVTAYYLILLFVRV